jgi:hypothetical protein
MLKKLKFKIGDKVEIYDYECEEYVQHGVIIRADKDFSYPYIIELPNGDQEFGDNDNLRLVDNITPKIPYGRLMR